MQHVLLLVICVLLEGSVTTLPLTLLLLIVLYCLTRADWIFIAAFVAGIILDVFLIRPLGVSSIFFLSTLLLIFLYQRKFEITSMYFMAGAQILCSMCYLWIFGGLSGIGDMMIVFLLGISTAIFMKRGIYKHATNVIERD